MAQIGEAATKTAASLDECIYCGKKELHNNKTKKQDPNLNSIKSQPESLGCEHSKLATAIPGKYTKANHHAIPVKQCFLKVKRLAQVALSVNYDINGSQNGIALPTVCNPYTHGGKTQNFGKFKPPSIKDEIAFKMMEEIKMQWHVGHHAYTEDETASSDAPDEGEINHQPYDEEVSNLLVDLCINWYEKEYCKNSEDKSEEIKSQLNDICEIIIKQLNAFETNPKSSSPYYVSKVASKFANR